MKCIGLGGKDLPKQYPTSCEHGSSFGALVPTCLYPDDTSLSPFPISPFVARTLFRVSLPFERVRVLNDGIVFLVFVLWIPIRERWCCSAVRGGVLFHPILR